MLKGKNTIKLFHSNFNKYMLYFQFRLNRLTRIMLLKSLLFMEMKRPSQL